MFLKVINLFRRSLSAIQRRDETKVPETCYASCNNAFIEAQRSGKSPTLCIPDSAFQIQLDSCRECVEANSQNVNGSLESVVDPKFEQFIDFCKATTPESGEAYSGAISKLSSAVVQISSYEATLSKLKAAASHTATVVITSSTVNVPPNATIAQAGASETRTLGLQPPPDSTTETWIAGAVIGPIVFITAMAAIAFWIRRRSIRRMRSAISANDDNFEYQGKAQLHGETADLTKFKSELHADSNIVHELDAIRDRKFDAELAAVEPVGSELGSLRQQGTDGAIKRKPLASRE